jgi:hypothetical protein
VHPQAVTDIRIVGLVRKVGQVSETIVRRSKDLHGVSFASGLCKDARQCEIRHRDTAGDLQKLSASPIGHEEASVPRRVMVLASYEQPLTNTSELSLSSKYVGKLNNVPIIVVDQQLSVSIHSR